MAMLEIKDLYVNYGMIAALKGISFEVNEGKVIALPVRDDIDYEVAEHLIVELYSK